MRKGLIGFVVLVSLALPAIAQADTSPPDLPYVLLQGLRPGTVEENYVGNYLGRIRNTDANGDGLDAKDIEINASINAATQRSSILTSFLRADLNGDGNLTQAELTTSLTYEIHGRFMPQGQFNQLLTRRITEVMAADTDGDKIITIAEMLSAAQRGAEAANNDSSAAGVNDLLALDPNGDGHLTYREMGDIARAAFRSLDTDGDGILTETEAAPVAAVMRQAQIEHQFMPCDLPKLPTNARFFVINAYEGANQPNVSVVGVDRVTQSADIAIEDGTDPVYLVAFSYRPMIWRLTGAVSRVSQFAMNTAAGGAINIDAGRVKFLRPGSCGSYLNENDAERLKARSNVIARATGLLPTAVVSTYTASVFSLPPTDAGLGNTTGQDQSAASGSASSGTADTLTVYSGNKIFTIQNGKITEQPSASTDGTGTASAQDRLTNQEETFTKGSSLLELDPKTVIAAAPVTPYDILPNQWGLKQLVADGHLVHDGNAYRILKTFAHFPAELTGAHSVTFILPTGVELPGGNLGHSKLIRE